MDFEKQFRKMKINQRIDLLKRKGEFVGSRFFNSYHVYLFTYNTHYIELYYRIGFDMIEFVEIQKNKKIIEAYAENVKIDNILDRM